MNPSDHCTLNGGVPVRSACKVTKPLGHIVPPPQTVALTWRTVTVALPCELPLHDDASSSAVMLYVVVAAGLTLRETVLLLVVCVKPSDQVMANGATPLSVAEMVADPPGQIEPPPETLACVVMTSTYSDALAKQPLAFVAVTQ